MVKIDVKTFLMGILKRAGCEGIREGKDNINCSCPFHKPRKNKNSFGVNFEKESDGYPYRCLSGKCDVSGNIYQLISHIYNCSYARALRIFNKRVIVNPINVSILKELFNNIHNINNELSKEVPIKFPPISKDKSPMLKYLKWRNENKQHNTMDLDYLIEKYKLYYCSEGRYSGRIIMPIRNLEGRWIQFNDRSVFHDSDRKSLHSFGNDITNTIHGLRESFGKKKVIITEGSFDMFQMICTISKKKNLREYGCVNIMGTIINDVRIALLSKSFEEAYILFDHDKAGIDAAFKAKCLLDDNMEVHDITRNIPKKKDPAICTYYQLIKALKTKQKPKLFHFKQKIN